MRNRAAAERICSLLHSPLLVILVVATAAGVEKQRPINQTQTMMAMILLRVK